MDPVVIFSVFDDIRRQAATGKIDLVGQYSEDIVVQEFPAKIARLVFLIEVHSDVGSVPRELGVRIEIPGMPPHIVDMRPIAGKPIDPSAVRAVVGRQVRLNDLDLTVPGPVKVFGIVDGKEIYAGKLDLYANPDQFPLPNQWGQIGSIVLTMLRARGGPTLDIEPELALRLLQDAYRSGVLSTGRELPEGDDDMAAALTPSLHEMVIYTKSATKALTWKPKVANLPAGVKSRIARRTDASIAIRFSRELTLQEIAAIEVS